MKWAAAALVAGLVVFEVTSALHVTGPDLNDNAAIFRTYAASDGWVAVHLGQLAGGLLVLGGLIALYRAWDNALGIAAAAATAASLAVLQGVDGVALKRAVDAWVSAAPPHRDAAFRVAEGVRWVEYGASAVTSVLLGLTVLLGAAAMRRRQAWLAWLGAVAAAGYGVSGVLIAADGFSGTQQSVGFAAQIALAVWLAGTALLAWRRAA